MLLRPAVGCFGIFRISDQAAYWVSRLQLLLSMLFAAARCAVSLFQQSLKLPGVRREETSLPRDQRSAVKGAGPSGPHKNLPVVVWSKPSLFCCLSGSQKSDVSGHFCLEA